MMKLIRILTCLYMIFVVVLVVVFVIISRKSDKNGTTMEEVVTNHKSMYRNYEYFSDEYIYHKFGVENLTEEEKERMLYYNEHINEMLLEMMKKGGNWRTFPVIKEIKEQYDESKGLLAEFDFDTVEYSKETLEILEEFGNTGRVSIIGIKGKQKKRVYMSLATNGGLENFSIDKVVDLTDEDGNELDTRIRCTKENFEDIILIMMDRYEYLSSYVAVTDSFKSKYSKYADLSDIFAKQFKPQNSYMQIYHNQKIDEENLTADFYWISDEVDKLYRVYFILDENQYIDDLEIEILE